MKVKNGIKLTNKTGPELPIANEELYKQTGLGRISDKLEWVIGKSSIKVYLNLTANPKDWNDGAH